ncbi:MAG: FcoT family thioesterase [Kofleriaceae bacterium]
MTMPDRTPVRSVEVPVELFRSILSPYRTGCRYLQQMWIDFYGEATEAAGAVGGAIVGRGQFSIPESFYIDDTGHFNAVEFNLCYNQIAYIYLAYCADRKLIPAMREVDLAYYRRQQLGGILIAKFSSSFHSRMAAERFWGEVSLPRTDERKRLWLLDTHIRYWDDAQGRSEGDVLLAFLKERTG